MYGKNLLAGMAVALALVLAGPGCSKSSSSGTSSDSGTPAGGSAVSGIEQEARDASMAEIAKHWTKTPDGWTTVLNEGSDFAPIIFVRQVKDLSIDHVDANDLSDADKMNGFEWAGQVSMKSSPGREAGDSGIAFSGMSGIINRQPGHWTQWVDYTPMPLQVQKQKGQWHIRTDNMLVSGKIPGPGDYAKAGVK